MPLRARFCQQCGGAMPQKTVAPVAGLTGRLPTAAILSGRYQIAKKLGQGGMGAVYLASDTRLQGKQWAVKEMTDVGITDPAERQIALEAFRQEAHMLATLDHANLPKVMDYFAEGGNQYLVMEFVQGMTLEQKMESAGGPLPERQVLGWADQLCDVLAYLHAQKPTIVFRDLKPGNIMAQPDGRIKLIDFGIARHFKPGQSKDTHAFGTPGYSPPEQHGKGQTDGRSDVYALGATLHHLLTGQDPNISPFHFDPTRRLNPTVSASVGQAIDKAVQVKVDARWQTMKSFHRALISEEQSVSAQPLTTPAFKLPSTIPARSSAVANIPLALTQQAISIPTQTQTSIAIDSQANIFNVLPPYAPYGKRVGAYIIDSIIVSVLLGIVAVMDEAVYADGAILVIGWLLFMLYWLGLTARSGQTWGKKTMGIRVVLVDGSPPGWGRAFMRQVVGVTIEVLLMYAIIGLASYLWPLWDKNRQTWHDKIAGTYVVDA